MRRGLSIALLATSVAVAGCGGDGVVSVSQNERASALFARDCSACHSLIGNESRHREGGDLVGYRLSRSALVEFTREMPTRRSLTSSQLNAVVEYVLEIEQHGRAH